MRGFARVYDHSLTFCKVLLVGGLALCFVGGIGMIPWVLRIGAILFVGGFFFWALVGGGAFVHGFLRALREHGLRAITEQPWPSVFYIALMLSFVAMTLSFGRIVWLMLRSVG